MEGNTPLSRHRKPTTSASDRFISIFSASAPSTCVSTAGDELSEDDVFWTGDFAESSNISNAPSTSSTPTFNHSIHDSRISGGGKVGFSRVENFGILAALPEVNNRSVFNHKTSISPSSSSSSSSTRMIPRPPVERQSSFSVKYLQSAPVSVPLMQREDKFSRRKGSGFDYRDDDEEEEEDDDDGEILPPHEMVARKSAKSPVLSCSVLEGAGRTLKGRDLRQVRNAVFRQTGFID